MIHPCPYHANGKICTHVNCPTTRKHKSICIHKEKNDLRCPMYLEWLELRESEGLSKKMAENGSNKLRGVSE